MIARDTELRALRKIVEGKLNELSRTAERHSYQVRMSASIGIVFLLFSGLSWILGAQSGALLPLAVAGLSGLLAIEPHATAKFAAREIREMEERLSREDIQFSWTRGKMPEITLNPLHQPAAGPPPSSGEDLL